jgi:C4-type Zn-finger protein
MFGVVRVECPSCHGEVLMLTGVGSDQTACPHCEASLTMVLGETVPRLAAGGKGA